MCYFVIDNDIEPAEIGVIIGKGPNDKQPFMVSFFTETEVWILSFDCRGIWNCI